MAFFSSSVSYLEKLVDVAIANPSQGQILKYDAVNQVWINSNNNLNDLSDVTITTPANGQILKYDGTNQKWINGALS